MEAIREEIIQHELGKIESIKPRIAELDEYKIELKEFYNELKSELCKKIIDKKTNSGYGINR